VKKYRRGEAEEEEKTIVSEGYSRWKEEN